MTNEDPKYRLTFYKRENGVEVRYVDYLPKSQVQAWIDRWLPEYERVEQSDEPDYGPGGVDGETNLAGLGGN